MKGILNILTMLKITLQLEVCSLICTGSVVHGSTYYYFILELRSWGGLVVLYQLSQNILYAIKWLFVYKGNSRICKTLCNSDLKGAQETPNICESKDIKGLLLLHMSKKRCKKTRKKETLLVL